MARVDKGGPHASRRRAHGCTVKLEPVGVTELEDVVFHEDGDGVLDFGGEVGASDGEAVVGIDVGIHRGCIGRAKEGSGGKGEGANVLNKVERTA